MTSAQHLSPVAAHLAFATRMAAIASIGLLLGACAQSGNIGLGMSQDEPMKVADAGSDDMGKALNYWGRKYVKNPNDKEAAINYAKNLKASGDSKQAFLVLQQASMMHGNDRELASEYGRLALENGQVELASKLLALADDQTLPDWRIVSGRGAALAKLGKYGEAVPMFERAHRLAPANPTVLNDLAMAHAGNGNLQEAERLLRSANNNPMARDKVSKNLALVLRLQGRNADAEAVTAAHTATAGGAYLTSPRPALLPSSLANQGLAMRQSVQPSASVASDNRVAQAAAE